MAYITFDQNPAIGTDWVDPHNEAAGISTNKQALVTIDADLPGSSITNLPATASGSSFVVNWAGSDAGAGVSGYDVYVQSNYGPWNLWLANTPALLLYAWPGTTNLLLGCTNLTPPIHWQPYGPPVVVTNRLEVIQPVAIPGNSLFLRALRP